MKAPMHDGVRLASAWRILLLLISVLALSSCEKKRTAFDFKFPPNAKGWVIVIFDPENGFPIQKNDNRAVVTIPPTKVIRIKHPLEEGWAKDRFFSVDPGGNEVEIAVEAGTLGTTEVGQSRQKVTYWAFFLGTEAERKTAPQSYQHVREILKSE